MPRSVSKTVFAGLVQNAEADMPTGAIIGGIVAAVVVVVILAGVGFFLLRYAILYFAVGKLRYLRVYV